MKLNTPAIRVLAAAEREELFHSVYGDYDWIALDTQDSYGGGRVTSTVRKLQGLNPPLLELAPRKRGDEHRGQTIRLTDPGRDALRESR